MNNPFQTLCQTDGYRVAKVDLGDGERLALAVYVSSDHRVLDLGEGVAGPLADRGSVDVKMWQRATDVERGECCRLQMLLEAVCRYFNAGGSWEELGLSLEVARSVIPGGLMYPGFYYHEGVWNSEGGCEHVWVSYGNVFDGEQAVVVWAECCNDFAGFINAPEPRSVYEARQNEVAIVEAEPGQPEGPGEPGEHGLSRGPLPQLPDLSGLTDA